LTFFLLCAMRRYHRPCAWHRVVQAGKKAKTALPLCFLALSAAVIWVLIAPAGAALAGDTLSQEAELCLDCHGKHGIIKKFVNGESIEAYVDSEGFSASVHDFECSDCHKGFAPGRHPTRSYRSKWQYKVQASRRCRGCHTDEEITRKAIHARLLEEEKEGRAPVCTDCHGTHSIKPVTGGKIFASEESYCLSCHEHELTMTFKGGETARIRADLKEIEGSVHNNLCCSDCHFGFSSEEHPRRVFRTGRDFTLASSEVCRRCHFDKYTKTLESIHFEMLSQGNLNAPVCTDCHGSHAITRMSEDRAAIARKCRTCHAGIYDIYAESVHGSSLIGAGNPDVPVCSNCHRAHDIGNPLAMEYHERIPEMCGNCHADEKVIGKYGLSTDVLKTYLSDFHGVTLNFYKKQQGELVEPVRPIAVCTDCHGTHNISSTAGPDATVVKANLRKKCQRCHEGAPEDFPDAWLSHYLPSFKTAPLVFIVNIAYKIFIPIMVIGLVLQILLHVWRYIVDR
jgi:hypothetical protein